MSQIDDIHISSIKDVITPRELRGKIPNNSPNFVAESRDTITKIFKDEDDRFLVIVGPCSIHNPDEALDYANQLLEFKNRFKDTLFVVMRVYFEKPRTRGGWKGLINDPDIDQTYDISKGLFMARDLLNKINSLGIPTATELLDNHTPQYIMDLISFTAIGARTVESQIHRQLACGISTPVGFKNPTCGNIKKAIDAIHTIQQSHLFKGIDLDGKVKVLETKGNNKGCIILRGSETGANYDPVTVENVVESIKNSGLHTKLIIDTSHGNSGKDFKKQSYVVESISKQLLDLNCHIKGVMIESNINEGNQPSAKRSKLKYGISITDSCVNLEETYKFLNILDIATKERVYKKDISNIRKKIDILNKKLEYLLKQTFNKDNLEQFTKISNERINIGKVVAEIKFKKNPELFRFYKSDSKKIFELLTDEKREQEILDTYDDQFIKDVFLNIMFDCKMVQVSRIQELLK
uniref:3-deoxy-7-phosphoheptulonate synthase n=1 Tax=viral metagenome TaxID=1070528 RepID=A0A6C0ACG5_9ZZZZ